MGGVKNDSQSALSPKSKTPNTTPKPVLSINLNIQTASTPKKSQTKDKLEVRVKL